MRRYLWPFALLLASAGAGWAQAGNQEPASGSERTESVSTSVPKETTEDTPAEESSIPPSERPSRSYLLIGIHASQGAENDPGGISDYASQWSSVTDLFGSVRLLKVRRRSETAIDYLGGASLYTGDGNLGSYEQQSQQATAEQICRWGRRRLIIRDWFNYADEGNLGSAFFGGTGAYNLRFSDASTALGATGGTYGSNTGPPVPASQNNYTFRSTYVSNVSDLSFSELLTPRSSAYASGTYALTNYLGNSESLFNTRQVSGSAGYSYQLSRKDTVGAVYGYQQFQFPDSAVGTLATNSVQFTYQHIVSGRTDFFFSVGPDIVSVNGGSSKPLRTIDGSGQAGLHYRWQKTGVLFAYSHSVTAGSGFLAGTTTDAVSASFNRTFFRSWRGSINGGYARSKEIAAPSTINGRSFSYIFAGTVVQRMLGRSLGAFASYQFDDESFGSCGASSACAPGIRRHVMLIGLDFYFHPLRLE